MNTRATERRFSQYNPSGRHIDLTRRLPTLKSSLSPEPGSPAARLRTHPVATPVHRRSTFVPALLAWLLILAAIAALIFFTS